MSNRITSDPQICGGEAVVRGTRIPAHVVLSHLAAGESFEGVLENFPTLHRDDILACLDYAAHLAADRAVAG